MISEGTIIRRIGSERARLQGESQTEFVKGFQFGLTIAVTLVNEIAQEAKNVRDEYRGRLNRWSAARFRQALGTALTYLRQGDRARAIRTLETAIEHEGEEDFTKRKERILRRIHGTRA